MQTNLFTLLKAADAIHCAGYEVDSYAIVDGSALLQACGGDMSFVFQNQPVTLDHGSCEAVEIDVSGNEVTHELAFMSHNILQPQDVDSPDAIAALVRGVEESLEQLRKLAPEPVVISYTDKVYLEFGSKDYDNRVWVGRDGMGSTCVNYSEDGLSVDVIAENGMGEPIREINLDSTEIDGSSASAEED